MPKAAQTTQYRLQTNRSIAFSTKAIASKLLAIATQPRYTQTHSATSSCEENKAFTAMVVQQPATATDTFLFIGKIDSMGVHT
jgi:hypothetical protein